MMMMYVSCYLLYMFAFKRCKDENSKTKRNKICMKTKKKKYLKIFCMINVRKNVDVNTVAYIPRKKNLIR